MIQRKIIETLREEILALIRERLPEKETEDLEITLPYTHTIRHISIGGYITHTYAREYYADRELMGRLLFDIIDELPIEALLDLLEHLRRKRGEL